MSLPDSDSPRHLATRGMYTPSTPLRAGRPANSNASVYTSRQSRRQGPRRRIDARPATPRRRRPASRTPELCFPVFAHLINGFILVALATLAGLLV
ncbi:hypothetical protein IAS59_001304 [Cryptococcus gattii]